MISTEYVYDRLKYYCKSHGLKAEGDEDNIESNVHHWFVRHDTYKGLVNVQYYVNEGKILSGHYKEIHITNPNFDDEIDKMFGEMIWFMKREYYNID